MLKIGDFSKLSRVSIRMLRYYDEIGLLIPEFTDPFTGYRHYGEAQLTAANRIAALRDMGFGLVAIAELMRRSEDTEAFRQGLLRQKEETLQEAENVHTRLRLLDTALERLGKDNAMNYTVTLKEIPKRYVASVRKVIPSYDKEGKLWEILMRETAPLRIQDGSPCYTTAIFHDGEFKENDVDVEVQKSVKGTYPDTENVVFKTEPPIQVASATCKGSYEQMNAVNEAVAHWVGDNGYVFAGKAFNIYHVSPHETQNPDEYVTEVCYPVRKQV